MRPSQHFQKTVYVLICIAGMTASVAEGSDRANEFIEILKTYRDIGEPFGVSSNSIGSDIDKALRMMG